MDDICKHCGKPESEHHAFEAKVQRWKWPKGCKCDRKAYFAEPLPICDAYRPFGPSNGVCTRCDHELACHAPKD